MIQDILPLQFDVSYKQESPRDGDYLFMLNGNDVFFHGETKSDYLPTCGEIASYCPDLAEKAVYLFSIDDKAFYYLADIPALPAGFTARPVQGFREYRPTWMGYAGITASHLALWYDKNRYCGKCRERMRPKADERALVCESCGSIIFAGISPAVIVAIVDSDRILFTRYANRSSTSHALVAGFMEVGQSLEATVRREGMEEVGLKVKNIRYYKSQPWGFSSSVLIGMFADLDGSPEITIDEKELQEALWVAREDITERDSGISLTSEMMDAFRRNIFPK